MNYYDKDVNHHHNCMGYQNAGPGNACPRKIVHHKDGKYTISGIDNSCTYTVTKNGEHCGKENKCPVKCKESRQLRWCFNVRPDNGMILNVNFVNKYTQHVSKNCQEMKPNFPKEYIKGLPACYTVLPIPINKVNFHFSKEKPCGSWQGKPLGKKNP